MRQDELINSALYEAAKWNDGLADAYSHMRDDPMYSQAKELAKAYRNLLRKRTGKAKSAIEERLDSAELVTIQELMADPKDK